jgi:predicted phosphodiesterase
LDIISAAVTTYGVISDVHGNLEALTAALAVLDRHAVDRVISVGDVVGYNGESNECVDLLRERGIESIAGNHDLIALGRLGTDRCAMRPAFTLRRTRRDLTPESRLFLAALPPLRVYEDRIGLIHGTLDDPCEYMTTSALVADNARRLRERLPSLRVCFFGHTHVPALYQSDGHTVRKVPAEGRVSLPLGDGLTFVNPGSIDAARRPAKQADFAIFDSPRGEVSFLSVPYDYEKVEKSAAAKGYRMTRADEALYHARRFPRRLGRRALRVAREFLRRAWHRREGSPSR